MIKRQFLIALAFVSVFSFLGGIVGGMLTGGQSLFAQMETNKKVDKLETGLAIVDDLIVRNIILVDASKNKILGEFFTSADGIPFLSLYSNDSPKNGILDTKASPKLMLTAINKQPMVIFYDKNNDERISIGIDNNEPKIGFHYENKTRLTMGTNNLKHKQTGNEEKVKGSICAFDQNGNLAGRFPSK
jgi:hypothetical protein